MRRTSRTDGERTWQMISTGVVCRDFIGRTFELDFLLERVARAQDGFGANLLIVGNAGIGKSRLIAEFTDALRTQGTLYASVACWEIGDAPYAPLIELADLLGIHDAALALTSADGDPGASGRERTRRYANFASALGARAADRVIVLVIEDIHWADYATLELYRYLGSALKEHRFVFVATQRNDEAIGSGDPALTRLRAAIEREASATVALSALPPADIRSLIAAVLRDDGRRVPKVLLEEIAELSDGRPFHAEELLRGMLDRRRDDTATSVTSVPRSLRATVHDRLVSLSERERTVLAYAAVIGRRFAAQFLATLANEALPEVLVTLRRARNLQLIVEDHDGAHFVFRHALTREVVYEEILFAEARELHARIAAELVRAPEPDVVAIAYHAWRSGENESAVRYNENAGDSAAHIFAHTDAIRHYNRAHQSAKAPLDRARLAEKTASALYAIGDLIEAAAWYAQAVADSRVGNDVENAHRIALEHARCLFEGGKFDEGIAMAKAVAIDLDGIDSPLRFQAETMAAGLLTSRRGGAEALVHLDDAERVQCTPDPKWVARHHSIKADALRLLRRFDESSDRFVIAVEAARAIEDREQVVRTLNNWAALHIERGEIFRAYERYTEAIDTAYELQSTRLIAWVGQNLAYTALSIGDFAEARTRYMEAALLDAEVPIAHVWGQAIAYRLATLIGDETLLANANIDEAYASATALANNSLIANVGGAILARRILTHEELMPLAKEIFRAVGGILNGSYWLFDSIPRGAPALIEEARALLVDAVENGVGEGYAAHLQLFDARVLLRNRQRDAAEKLAREAYRNFTRLGWAIEAAYALEVAGDVKGAVEAFRRMGATAEVTRLTTTDQRAPRKRGETTLTKREREIASLIAAEKTNRQIAEALVISERTVETHVAAIFQKLGVCNRRELALLLST